MIKLEEGLEETLTLHRLGMLPFLKRSFRTTNWHRGAQQHDRRPHPEGQAIEQLSPETQMGRRCTPRYRTTPATREGIQTPPATQASTK